MADGRANNGGHSTKGRAGRPPKADEIAVIEQMDAIAVPAKAWARLWALVESGDAQAIKTWLAYRFGQPKQSIDHTTKGEAVGQTVIIYPKGHAKPDDA
jgi:hypothetical protein